MIAFQGKPRLVMIEPADLDHLEPGFLMALRAIASEFSFVDVLMTRDAAVVLDSPGRQ